MNPTLLRLLPLGLLLAAGFTLLTNRERGLRALRAQVAEPAGPAATAAAEPSPPAGAPARSEPALTDAERRELLTLRGEVTRLRQEKPRLDAARQENQRLKAALAPGAAAAAAAGAPAGSTAYIPKSRLKLAGFATPAEAVQSFFWALAHNDTNVLQQVVPPEMAKGIAEDPEAASHVPGMQIRSVTQSPDGTADLEIQLDPANTDPGMHMQLELVDGRWRIRRF